MENIVNLEDVSIYSKDSGDVRVILRKGDSSTMYSVNADSDDEAFDLFSKGSHKVKFVGSLYYNFGD